MTEGTPDRRGVAEAPCPECGALASGRSCFLCGHTATDFEVPSKLLISIPHQRVAQTFTLSSLFLSMTLMAVCFGAIKVAPGLGIPLAALSAVAFSRTVKIAKGEKETGATTSSGRQVMSFVSSLVLAFLLMLAAIVAFVGAVSILCASMGAQNPLPVPAILLAISGVIAFLLLARRWTRQVKRR